MPERKRLVVLASGFGTNLQAIIESCQNDDILANVAVVISEKDDAYALERARAAKIPTVLHSWLEYAKTGKTRQEYDSDLANKVEFFSPDLIVLVGWMRLLTRNFLEKFPLKVINLHPALPGKFPGMHAIERAWKAHEEGELDETGVLIHYIVDEGIDNGPPIVSQPLQILPADTLGSFTSRMHALERELTIAGIKLALFS